LVEDGGQVERKATNSAHERRVFDGLEADARPPAVRASDRRFPDGVRCRSCCRRRCQATWPRRPAAAAAGAAASAAAEDGAVSSSASCPPFFSIRHTRGAVEMHVS